MLSKKVRLRIGFLIFFLILAVTVFFFTVRSLNKNIVYFFSPTEIYNKNNISFNKKIRIGGLVKDGSIKYDNKSVNFIITDLENELLVTYTGLVPNLFSEGKGVVAEGKLKDRKFFVADVILAKHDENYMPPEVIKTLKKN